MRPVRPWACYVRLDNIAVAFSRTASVTTVDAAAAGNAAAAGSAAACFGTYSWSSTSDQNAASGITATPDSSCVRARARQTAAAGTPYEALQQACFCLDYKIPARHEIPTGGRTVL
jgi:hypothetical protein